MNETTLPKTLSKIDWFSLITGSIGLIADIGTISAVFISSQSPATTPIAIWVILFVSMLYTIIVIDFYARRYLYNKAKEKFGTIKSSHLNRIENGVFSMVFAISIPMLACYSIYAALSINNSIQDEKSRAAGLAIILGIVIGVVGGGFLCYFLDMITKDIYLAFDTDIPPK